MKRFSILFLLFIMTTALSAQTVLELWPNGAPNSTSNPDDKAQLTAFLPKKERATGRAVIASDISGCREIVNRDVSGFLIKPRDSESLIKALEKFTELDGGARSAMGQAGRKWVEEHFDRQKVVDAYMNELNQILV